MTTFSFTGVVQTWTVPTTGWWSFTAWGGSGGDFRAYPGTWDESGGLAQTVTGRVYLTAGTDIDIWVGGAGHDSSRPGFPSDGSGGWSKTGYHGGACGSPSPQVGHAAGGGGATVVELPSGLLLVCGGAGGAGLRGDLATRCSGGWSGHGLAPAGESGDDRAAVTIDYEHHPDGTTGPDRGDASHDRRPARRSRRLRWLTHASPRSLPRSTLRPPPLAAVVVARHQVP